MCSRQVDELQELVEKLKSELASKTDSAEVPNMKALELENLKHLELIADMKLQLEQVRIHSPSYIFIHFASTV